MLTSFLVARSISRYEKRLTTKVRKLEETLKSVKKVEQAKAILMKTKNIQEKDAYEFLRKWAMERRVPIGQVASAIIDADGMLT
jgi:AmiR/NasT family two-component response regulator